MSATEHCPAALALMTALMFSLMQAGANVQAETNGPLLGPLCELLSLPAGAAGLEEKIYMAKASYHNLQDMNLTLSDSEWRQLFDKQAPDSERPKTPKAPHDTDKSRLEHWQDWLDNASRLDAKQVEEEILKKTNLANADRSKKAAVLAAIQPILRKASEYNKQLKLLTADSNDDSKMAIQKLINDSTYGDNIGATTEIIQASTTGAGTIVAVSTACGSATTSTKVKTTAGLAVCLCAKAATCGVGKVCAKGQAETATLADNFNNVGAVVATIDALCIRSRKQAITAASIRSAIGDMLKHLHTDTARSYLGEYTSTGCTGQANSGECVIYHSNAAAAKTAIQSSEWYTKLTAASDLLEKKQKRNTQIKTPNQLLEAEEQSAYSLALQMQLTPPDFAAAASTTKGSRSPSPTEKKTGCAAATNKTAAECKNLGCEHDKKENKCKPKAATENAAAGARGDKAEGAAGTAVSTGCPRHGTDKTACENDKTGNKKNCAWRKGKRVKMTRIKTSLCA
ncbi:Trypanosomal VSG domain containing protein [Trypanosoma brucei equiperdum]|uniref:Trypanosomal VSG domain containing protein n=1 Tax=Trypanosoma brucei equiperdum TaxID=630700 RepID=A0A3L6L6E6_9TRYP|nr:Trypanosomal VSG domain containing protein [Trypanosoma brucei equiperdum]RHW72182.1 Trypanosomal VSG domain containing protein [Trypanosoma brucei equiperdum]RHW72201.1 Trypanosomal VSG domain containing protein [Trypanosoma brucei equiperdum]RHW72295.1 Trypanosomal VSG domain containing protein [Trypanosoma brucei equiperdum]